MRSLEISRDEAEFIVEACERSGAPQWFPLQDSLRKQWGMSPRGNLDRSLIDKAATILGSIPLDEMRQLSAHLKQVDAWLARRADATDDPIDKSAFRLARFGGV